MIRKLKNYKIKREWEIGNIKLKIKKDLKIKNMGNGMPRVTHILFYTAFILANYSASQEVISIFVLASCRLAVSPIPLMSISQASLSSIKGRVVSAPESYFSA